MLIFSRQILFADFYHVMDQKDPSRVIGAEVEDMLGGLWSVGCGGKVYLGNLWGGDFH
jgi:hypothetical protein